MKTERTGPALALAGAFSTAVAASACCIGPLLLAGLGLGGAAYAVALEPYRVWFIMASALLLGGAFYLVYRKDPALDCGEGEPCAHRRRTTVLRLALWVVAALAVAAMTFPYYVQLLF